MTLVNENDAVSNNGSNDSTSLVRKSKAPSSDLTQAVRNAIQNIAVGPDRGRDISRDLAQQVLAGVLEGEVSDVQTAVFLIAMRMKRESMQEFIGLFDALAAGSKTVVAPVDQVICLADPFDGYVRNVTMTPFLPAVLAACGYPSVIHGVKTVGPKHGVTAHKVFRAASMQTKLGIDDAAARLDGVGWTYIDQSQYAPDLYALQSLRDQIIKRSALTTLERLLLPIRGKTASHLVLGYVHKAYPSIYATVAQVAGYQSTLLLKGVEGGLAPALNKPLRRFYVDGELPSDIDAQKQLIEIQPLFDARVAAQPYTRSVDTEDHFDSDHAVQTCLDLGFEVLKGRRNKFTQNARDSLCLSAANILIARDSGLSLPKAVEKVQICLDNGAVNRHFQAFT